MESGQPSHSDQPANTQQPSLESKPKSHFKLLIIFLVIILFITTFLFAWHNHNKNKVVLTKTNTSSNTADIEGLKLNTTKDYGNKYADGILPVGDGKYVTSDPKTGYIYACTTYAQNLQTTNGGASTRGPWFMDNNTEYDINKKIHVEGEVMWQAEFSNTISGDTRVITTNDLPSQPTGVFPIASTDPAYQYDQNPNHITAQDFTYRLPLDPTFSNMPNCMSGQSGIMLTGIALFDAFDAGGRDAGAWEVQDNCDGHPQMDGVYHYHTLSSCISNISVHTVIGYALDGFPITGPEVGPDNFLTTSDLDECHGIVSEIDLDGKDVTMYHYVMTEDFPYSISCFRGTPIQSPAQMGADQSQNQGSPPG